MTEDQRAEWRRAPAAQARAARSQRSKRTTTATMMTQPTPDDQPCRASQ
jgi:hypothetical protein